MASVSKYKNISGNTYNRLTAIEETEKRSTCREVIWKFKCSCGNYTYTSAAQVVKGRTKSCGCLVSELGGANLRTHGMSKTPEFGSWSAMKQRCTDPNHSKYMYYKDVEIQENWISDFTAFLSHIGEQPKDHNKWTLDRICNDKGYVEGNVRWATMQQQSRNRTLQQQSKTKINGVTIRKANRRGYDEFSYVACVYQIDGKKKSRAFSINKYGQQEALRLAIEARNEMFEEINKQGAGYTVDHGKQKGNLL